MIQKFFDWLIDTYLYDYIVSRKDYNVVQTRMFGTEQYIRKLHKELEQSYSELYSRSFQTMEQYGEKVAAEFVENNRIDLREFQFSYHFRIPHTQFYTLRKPTNWFRETKEIVIAKLTKAFEVHMQKNLFRDL